MFTEKKDPSNDSATGEAEKMEELENLENEIEKLEDKKVELEAELNATDEQINECRYKIYEIKLKESEDEEEAF